DHALEVSKASVILAHAERDADLDASRLAAQLPLGRIRYGADPGDRATAKAPKWESLAAETTNHAFPPRQPSAPAITYFPSGSTGKPNGVTHTFGTLGWMMASAGPALQITSDDVVVPGSSHSHIGGMLLALAALAAGAKVVVPRTFDGDELLPLLQTHRPT